MPKFIMVDDREDCEVCICIHDAVQGECSIANAFITGYIHGEAGICRGANAGLQLCHAHYIEIDRAREEYVGDGFLKPKVVRHNPPIPVSDLQLILLDKL